MLEFEFLNYELTSDTSLVIYYKIVSDSETPISGSIDITLGDEILSSGEFTTGVDSSIEVLNLSPDSDITLRLVISTELEDVEENYSVTTKMSRLRRLEFDGNRYKIGDGATSSNVKVANMQDLSYVATKYNNNIPEDYTFDEFIRDIYRKVLDAQLPANNVAGSLDKLVLMMSSDTGEFGSTITGRTISKAEFTRPTMKTVSKITDGESTLSSVELSQSVANGAATKIIYRSKSNYNTTIEESAYNNLTPAQKENYYPTWNASGIQDVSDYKVMRSTDSSKSSDDTEVTLANNTFVLPSITLTKPTDESLTKTFYSDYYYAKQSYTESKTDKLVYNTYGEDITDSRKIPGGTISNTPTRASVTGYYPGYTNISIYGNDAKVADSPTIGTPGETRSSVSKIGNVLNIAGENYVKPGPSGTSSVWEIYYVKLLKYSALEKYDTLNRKYASQTTPGTLVEEGGWYVLLDGNADIPQLPPTTDEVNTSTGINWTIDEINNWKRERVEYCRLYVGLPGYDSLPAAYKIILEER